MLIENKWSQTRQSLQWQHEMNDNPNSLYVKGLTANF